MSEALAWPNVPSCYGWLSLDRRGRWRLKGEPVSHRGLIDFIGAQYGNDDSGNWIFQNGPQTVYVALDYTPYVFRMGVGQRLTTHTGVEADTAVAVYLDEDGNVLLQTRLGIGLLDDRDLPIFVAGCSTADGNLVTEEALLDAMAGQSSVMWCGMILQSIDSREVPLRFNFQKFPAQK